MKQDILMIVIGLAVVMGLTGCQLMRPVKQKPNPCHQADVLLSDLKKPIKNRQYELRSGERCHELHIK